MTIMIPRRERRLHKSWTVTNIQTWVKPKSKVPSSTDIIPPWIKFDGPALQLRKDRSLSPDVSQPLLPYHHKARQPLCAARIEELREMRKRQQIELRRKEALEGEQMPQQAQLVPVIQPSHANFDLVSDATCSQRKPAVDLGCTHRQRNSFQLHDSTPTSLKSSTSGTRSPLPRKLLSAGPSHLPHNAVTSVNTNASPRHYAGVRKSSTNRRTSRARVQASDDQIPPAVLPESQIHHMSISHELNSTFNDSSSKYQQSHDAILYSPNLPTFGRLGTYVDIRLGRKGDSQSVRRSCRIASQGRR